ncbi:hypothetical protein X801_05525 [Opisthorchis viverrini]|uniref:Uncharacterized protein n=1 Tax=Opisthorchis viverrini TaxID=6198 RepID=A0A1S8WVW6_OPIVI|nr:hypothetical protein X801_05525 [Opisthorchis viverrini]
MNLEGLNLKRTDLSVDELVSKYQGQLQQSISAGALFMWGIYDYHISSDQVYPWSSPVSSSLYRQLTF